jgi:hypothetical protein
MQNFAHIAHWRLYKENRKPQFRGPQAPTPTSPEKGVDSQKVSEFAPNPPKLCLLFVGIVFTIQKQDLFSIVSHAEKRQFVLFQLKDFIR